MELRRQGPGRLPQGTGAKMGTKFNDVILISSCLVELKVGGVVDRAWKGTPSCPMETFFCFAECVFWQIKFCSSVILGMWASNFLSEGNPFEEGGKTMWIPVLCHFAGRAFTLLKQPERPTPGHPLEGGGRQWSSKCWGLFRFLKGKGRS